MQNLPPDVVRYIEKRFPERWREEVTSVLLSAKIETKEIPSQRLLRCALFASDGEIDRLHHYVALLAIDWRDVIVAAEYEILDGSYVLARDFASTVFI